VPNTNPLCPVVTAWMTKIGLALDLKKKRFQPDADEGMRFLSGPYDWMYGKNRDPNERRYFVNNEGGDIPAPKFQMTVNKTAELTQIFGPVLYHKNPNRTVTPREVPMPTPQLVQVFGSDPGSMLMLQQAMMTAASARAIDTARGDLMSAYLNFTPQALDLKTEARWAIDEGIIKGCGLLWTEVWQTPVGQRMVGSFYDSVDNLVIDPDATTFSDAKWIARRRVQPVWEAERRFQLQPGTLKATTESLNRQAEVDSDASGQAEYMRRTGKTQDLITYWDVYSKCGAGGRLAGFAQEYRQELEWYGDYVYLAVCSNEENPLNVPDQLWDLPAEQARPEIAKRLAWHTPFWADGAWPCAPLAFHNIPGDPWPLSHLAPGMGELKAINWLSSVMVGKIRITMRDFIAVLEEVPDDLRQSIINGADFELLKVKASGGKPIGDLIQFLQHPPFNVDIFTVLDRLSAQFDKRVGLNELMYGESSHQYRSAAEAEVKQRGMSVRPDDMANKVEDWMGAAARNEAIAVRWHLGGADVAPMLGQFGAAMWDRLVVPTDPRTILFGYDYRVEANSVRKPNREKQAANAKDLMQTLFPFFSQLATQGIPDPYNALIKFWGQAIDQNVDGFILNLPPPMPAPAPGGEPSSAPPQAA
jgi:hypothetical protein